MNAYRHDVEVEVWRVALEQPPDAVERLNTLLADDELARSARYRFESDWRRSIVRRGALRSILAEYVGLAAADLRFAYGPQGKPSLAAPDAEIYFNLSHSGELALVAVGQTPLGVDLERWREVADADLVARRFFTPNEVAIQRAALDGNRLFLQHWTRKEAIIKAVGKGLSMPLDTFDVS
ncbi:MAG: 4'-phosphopantetheinyl transferase family protein, partial [Candidatus Saccharimonadales bacterium]